MNSNKDTISKEMLRIVELEKKIEEIKQAVRKLSEIEEELKEIKTEVEKKQEQKEIEENLHFIRELAEIEFWDLKDFQKFSDQMAKIGLTQKEQLRAGYQHGRQGSKSAILKPSAVL